MKNFLLVLLASAALVLSQVSCTSSDSSSETGEQIASEGGENPEMLSENPDAAVGDDSLADVAGGDVGAAETLSEGNLTDPTLQDPSLDPNANSETAAITDPNQPIEANQPQLDSAGNPVDPNAQAAAPPAETQSSPATDSLANNAAPAPEVKPTETVPMDTITEAPAPIVSEPAPPPPSYQKMKDATWVVGKKVVNAVYFARPGDTWKSIAEKIYGDASKHKELKKINSSFKKRDIRVGDKVYYNSPNRPEDSTKLVTYYEDKGLQPQVYTAKEGDKVKTVAKELLGFDNAWKEVWGSNSFESKKSLDPGTEIKYWKEDTAVPPVLAGNSTENLPPPPDMGSTPPPSDMASNAPPPPPDMGSTPPPSDMASNVPPPPPPDMGSAPPPPPDMASNAPPPPPPDMGSTPPPPPDMASNAPPPPPPDMGSAPPPPPDMGSGMSGSASGSVGDDTTIAGMDQETIMIVGIGALALLLAVVFIVKRKNKQRQEFEQAMNETQVG